MSLIDFLKEKAEALADQLEEGSKDVKAEVTDEVDKGLAAVKSDVGDLVTKIKSYALENVDTIFAILRRIKPVLVHDKFALVTRFDDVQDILSHDDVFHTLYPEKLAAVGGVADGPVGRPNTPAHMRTLANMQIAFRREEIPTLAVPFIEQRAAAAVAASKGRLDLVSGLGRLVPPSWISHYIGVPDPGPNQLADWADDIFRYVFADISNDSAVADPSLAAAAKFRAHVDSVIAERKKNRGQNDDVLERFLTMQDSDIPDMSDERIRATLMIFVYGTVTLTARTTCLAIDELLRRPEELAGAQAAARAGNTDLVADYVWEALRFNAINPGLFRTAQEDYVVARGDRRATTIPKGTMVFAALASAMLDGLEIDDPTEFRLRRPAYQYMHFGHGLHECFGRYLSYQQVPILVSSVLEQNNLRRAPGEDGKFQVEGGIFPIKMVVEFDA